MPAGHDGGTYRGIAADEHEAAAAVIGLGFGIPSRVSDWLARSAPEEYRVLEEGAELVTALRLGGRPQYWLGRALPSAQVMQLATPPEHRTRRHGLRLLEGLFAELHQAGVPTVTLRPSTARFYRLAGFEFAGAWNLHEAQCEHLPPLAEGYRVRRLPPGKLEPAIELYRRVAPTRHGAFERDERWWQRHIAHTWPHEDGQPINLLLEGPDGPVGWALVASSFDGGGRHLTLRLRVQDWGALPGHDLGVLAMLGGYRSMGGVVRWSGPDPDPSLLLLPNEVADIVERPHWMLRVVDVAGAFGARPYPPGAAGRIAFSVEDRACPWNSGTWTLQVEGGRGRVERGRAAGGTAGATEVRADVRGLAALFTGFAGPEDLARAGLLTGLDPDGAAFLRAAFASPRPWTLEIY